MHLIVKNMSIWEIFIIALSLAMDAFAVSICKGLSVEKVLWRQGILVGLYFGLAQALMPVIGYLLGASFKEYIVSIDHWIAFILLAFIGINMIRESFSNEEECNSTDSFTFKELFPLAIATSIDALAVGVTFAFLSVNIVLAAVLIGITTFTLCIFGTKLGSKLGDKFKKNAERAGGAVLIIIGSRILITHLLGA